MIALRNLRARIRQRAGELGLDLNDIQSENMAEPQRTMFEYAKPSLTRAESSIDRPNIAANNFKIKPNIIK